RAEPPVAGRPKTSPGPGSLLSGRGFSVPPAPQAFELARANLSRPACDPNATTQHTPGLSRSASGKQGACLGKHDALSMWVHVAYRGKDTRQAAKLARIADQQARPIPRDR